MKLIDINSANRFNFKPVATACGLTTEQDKFQQLIC